MNCDQAIELLPWLLNGTLAGEDREEVRRHLQTCQRCREALAETRAAWSAFAQHIPSQDLVALAWGEPPAGVDPQVAEEHLASCPQCADELEMARMSRRLEEEDNVAPFPFVRKRPESGSGARTWRAAAIAAGLAAIVASGGWLHELRQASLPAPQPAQAAAPTPAPVPPSAQPSPEDVTLRKQVDGLMATLRRLQDKDKANEEQARKAEVQLAELQKQRETPRAGELVILDTSAVVRGGEAPQAPEPKEVRRSDLPLAVVLQAAKDDQGPAGRKAEIVDGNGRRLQAESVLRPNESGYYTLQLPAGFLKPGRYTIQLSDPKSGEKREKYAIRVQ